MAKWVYLAFLVAAVAYVFLRGGRDERVIATVLTLGSIATSILYRDGFDFIRLQPSLIALEIGIFAIALTIAYRSSRFWPMFIAAFQMAVILSLLTPAFGQNLVSYGLGVAQGMWAYLQLAVLVLAIVRERRRMRRVSAIS